MLPQRPLLYRQQNSPQTLAEGLAEYYAANAGVVTLPHLLPPESRELFRNHDICHVIFGLDTSLEDETIADTRILLSCDVGFRHYARYLTSDPQVKEIFRQCGYFRIVMKLLKTVPRIVKSIVEAFRTSKRWPWMPPQQFQERTLADLRGEYGIRLV